jgi:hypothetical protein
MPIREYEADSKMQEDEFGDPYSSDSVVAIAIVVVDVVVQDTDSSPITRDIAVAATHKVADQTSPAMNPVYRDGHQETAPWEFARMTHWIRDYVDVYVLLIWRGSNSVHCRDACSTRFAGWEIVSRYHTHSSCH